MKNHFPTSVSSALLILIYCLERFSYYGLRVILLQSAVDDDIAFIDMQFITSYYAAFMFIFHAMPFLMGILSDFFLERKSTIIIGGVIAFLGYLLLIPFNFYLFLIGLLLISIGVGLVRVNLIVMLGRMFQKSDRGRNTTFLFCIAFINIAAFLSMFGIGYLSEDFGYYIGYGLIAISTLLYIIIYYLTKNKILFIEEDSSITETKIDENILDAESIQTINKSNLTAPFLGAILLIMVNILFWSSYELWSIDTIGILENSGNVLLLGSEFDLNQFQSVLSIFTIVILFLIAFLWQIKSSGSSISKLGYGLIVVALALVPIYFDLGDIFSGENILYPVLSIFILLAIGEAFISAISLSYMTRLSPVKYAASILGFYLLCTFFVKRAFDFIYTIDPISYYDYASPIFALIIGILLLVFKKGIIKVFNGID